LTARRSPAGELCFGAIANQLLQFPVLFLQLPPDPLLNRGSGAPARPRGKGMARQSCILKRRQAKTEYKES
jgi:hypothetical protein